MKNEEKEELKKQVKKEIAKEILDLFKNKNSITEKAAYAKLLYDFTNIKNIDEKLYNKIKKLILKKFDKWSLAIAYESVYNVNAGLVYKELFPDD